MDWNKLPPRARALILEKLHQSESNQIQPSTSSNRNLVRQQGNDDNHKNIERSYASSPQDNLRVQSNPSQSNRGHSKPKQQERLNCLCSKLCSVKSSGYAVVDGWCKPKTHYLELCEWIYSILDKNDDQPGERKLEPKVYRSDTYKVITLDKLNKDAENYPALQQVVDNISSLNQCLHKCSLITEGHVSLQVAQYNANSTGYTVHTDASLTYPHRRVTAVYYVSDYKTNEQDAGGQLVLYPCTAHGVTYSAGHGDDTHDKHGRVRVVVAPLLNRLVVFDSIMEHEVLPNKQNRLALTIWFHCTPATSPPIHPPTSPMPHPMPAAHHASHITDPDHALNHHDLRAYTMHKHIHTHTHLEQYHRRGSRELTQASYQGSIFVSIASYRDPDTVHTVCSLFESAANPGRLVVGICWQLDWAEDSWFMQSLTQLSKYMAQIRWVVVSHTEASGPWHARGVVQNMYQQEHYYLQIDSHMRFAADWDAYLCQQLHLATAMWSRGLPVISTYPPDFKFNGVEDSVGCVQVDQETCLTPLRFDEHGILRLSGSYVPQKQQQKRACVTCCTCTKARSQAGGSARPLEHVDCVCQCTCPCPGNFWAAGFNFSLGKIVRYLPYNKVRLPGLFNGEESVVWAILVSHNCRVFSPATNHVFHAWSRSYRRTVYQDNANYKQIQQQSVQVVRSVLRRWTTGDARGMLAQGVHSQTGQSDEDSEEVSVLGTTASEKCSNHAQRSCGQVCVEQSGLSDLERYIVEQLMGDANLLKQLSQETGVDYDKQTIATPAVRFHN